VRHQAGLEADHDRVDGARAAELLDQRPGRDAHEQRHERQQQERERDGHDQRQEQRAEPAHGGANPARRSRRCPRGESSSRTKSSARRRRSVDRTTAAV
jgi:hypothetical protein